MAEVMVPNGKVRIIYKYILLKINYFVYYMIMISNIMLDLSDTELNLKAKFCNDLLSVLDDLNCGDCRKRGKFI